MKAEPAHLLKPQSTIDPARFMFDFAVKKLSQMNHFAKSAIKLNPCRINKATLRPLIFKSTLLLSRLEYLRQHEEGDRYSNHTRRYRSDSRIDLVAKRVEHFTVQGSARTCRNEHRHNNLVERYVKCKER